MTIQEAIDKVKELEPSQYGPDIMIDWLSRLDAQIWREVFLTHEGKPCFESEVMSEAIDRTFASKRHTSYLKGQKL